jgi:hypothetical protein
MATVYPAHDVKHDRRERAAAFMEGYAQDLRGHRRDALPARYHPDGAFRMGHGRKRFLTADSLVEAYRTRWRGPTYFQWEDLSYEPLPPDAVVVVGKFRWADTTQSDTLVYSYTALLTQHKDSLRIRVEDESRAP